MKPPIVFRKQPQIVVARNLGDDAAAERLLGVARAAPALAGGRQRRRQAQRAADERERDEGGDQI